MLQPLILISTFLSICFALDPLASCSNLYNVTNSTGYLVDIYNYTNTSDLSHPMNFALSGYKNGNLLSSQVMQSVKYNFSDTILSSLDTEAPKTPFVAVISTVISVNTSGIYEWYFSSSNLIVQFGAGNNCCGDFASQATIQQFTRLDNSTPPDSSVLKLETYLSANDLYPLRLVFIADLNTDNLLYLSAAITNNFFDVENVSYKFNYTETSCSEKLKIDQASQTSSSTSSSAGGHTHVGKWMAFIGIMANIVFVWGW